MVVSPYLLDTSELSCTSAVFSTKSDKAFKYLALMCIKIDNDTIVKTGLNKYCSSFQDFCLCFLHFDTLFLFVNNPPKILLLGPKFC